MVQRALDPTSGRIVPIDDMACTHFGSQRAILDAVVRYQDNRRVSIKLRENVGGKLRAINEKMFFDRLHQSIDFLQKLGQSVLDEIRENKDLQGTHGDGGHAGGARIPFSTSFYEAARSKAQIGRETADENNARRISERGQKGE